MAKLERKPAERVAVAGVIVQALSGVLAYVFYWLSQSASAWMSFSRNCILALARWYQSQPSSFLNSRAFVKWLSASRYFSVL